MSKNKLKAQSLKRKVKVQSLKLLVLYFSFTFLALHFTLLCFAQEDFVYDSKGKRNPFIPLVTPDGRLLRLDEETVDKGVSLEGIIYDKSGLSYAIVNGTVVKTGESIDGYQVAKIEKNKIVLVKDGNPIELELKEAK